MCLFYVIEQIYLFFLLSQKSGQTSRGSNDIPTRLAPRRAPILCRQIQRKILFKKKGEKRGGLGQNPQNKQVTKRKKHNKRKIDGLRDPRARETTPKTRPCRVSSVPN